MTWGEVEPAILRGIKARRDGWPDHKYLQYDKKEKRFYTHDKNRIKPWNAGDADLRKAVDWTIM